MIEEQIFTNGNQFFDSLSEAIASAQTSIQFEMYIFETGNLGTKILELLVKAHDRGVQTQLLLDGVGCSEWTFREAERWRKRGIDLRFFHPLPWQNHPRKIWESLSIKKITIGLSKLTHRNHRKICIIDRKILFIGGMNISDHHLSWRDTSARVKGMNLSSYLESFEKIWNFSQSFYGLRWLAISKAKKRAYDRLLTRIRTAKKIVWITNPYFVPDFKLIRVLCRAARSGVDVKLLLPARSDIFGLKFAIQGLYTLLLTFEVKIFEYTPSTLHAKTIVIDDWVSVGSSNLDHRSMIDNLESDTSISLPQTKEVVKKQFQEDINLSSTVELNRWKNRSFYYRFLERFFLLFRKIL